jgi:hypothetical protein
MATAPAAPLSVGVAAGCTWAVGAVVGVAVVVVWVLVLWPVPV